MTYLLDTCAAIWVMADNKISEDAEAAISNAHRDELQIFISPITGWEVGMLSSKGKLALLNGPLGWYDDLKNLSGISELRIDAEELIASSFLQGTPPNDPFDRLIIATANKYDATIITRDKKILAYAAAGNCKALEC